MPDRTIVLTNDDGYEAPGLHAAFYALRELGQVVVVAPKTERSACSHTITLRKSLIVERLAHDEYGETFIVEGTPADCVRLAYAELLGRKIDLVVSGVNNGANAGVDVFYSGTVAGAREGCILKIPSIAVSQALRRGVETNWHLVSELTRKIVAELLSETLSGSGFWNINFPAPIPSDAQTHVHRVPVAAHPMPMVFQRTEREGGRVLEFGYGVSYWLREVTAPTDYTVIRDGGIAISAVPLLGRF